MTICGQTEAVALTRESSIVFSRLLKKQAAEVSGKKVVKLWTGGLGEEARALQRAAVQGPAPRTHRRP